MKSICKGCELKKECPVTDPKDVTKEKDVVTGCTKFKKKAEKTETKRKLMVIKDTKLGVTAVFSHEDCKDLGLDPDMTTKEAIKEIRKRIGLEGMNNV